MDPERWGIFLMDVEGCQASVYMMKFGAYIPLSGRPFLHDPSTFPVLKRWQRAAALEVVYEYLKEGKVLGPFPGTTRRCPILLDVAQSRGTFWGEGGSSLSEIPIYR